MLSFLLWYVIISYLIGFVIFAVEVARATAKEEYHLIGFGFVLLFLSPLTAWHGVLHYLAVWWHRTNGTPFKPFI